MLYLENRTRFRHVCGTKISAMPNFIFTSNTFMGLKSNPFGVILDFIVFTIYLSIFHYVPPFVFLRSFDMLLLTY